MVGRPALAIPSPCGLEGSVKHIRNRCRLGLWGKTKPSSYSRSRDGKSATHPEKDYFSKQAKLSKLDIVRYFSIAPGALVGIRDRPLAFLKRFVNGSEGEAFYQKRAPTDRPAWLRTTTLSFSGRTAEEIVVDDELGWPGSSIWAVWSFIRIPYVQRIWIIRMSCRTSILALGSVGPMCGWWRLKYRLSSKKWDFGAGLRPAVARAS